MIDGAHLKRIREATGLSLNEASNQAGMSRAHLVGLERNTRKPSLDALEALLAAYGHTLVIVPVADESEFTALDKDALRLVAQAGHTVAVMATEVLNERAEGSLWMRLQQLERTVGRYSSLLASLGIKE
jgi:transcriptional regulator with XRE-family HTH domain